MTLLSRRKRRTTARRITPATLAAKFVALAALVGTPAVAQPPPGYVNPQGGMLPLPPGYRPRTPPPQAKAPPSAPSAPGASGSGKVMYFQKPADALTATGASDDTDAVAQLNRTAVVPASADVPAPALLPPPASRYVPPADAPPLPAPVPVPATPPTAAVAYQQPGDLPKSADLPFVANKQPTIRTVPPEFIKLPPKENIFMVYNDLELEKAIMERLRQDLLEQFIRQYEADPTKKRKPTAEEQKRHLDSQQYLVFPPLPVVSPPGVAYQSKTASYAPSKMLLEPGYVVHRRLYFEEKNSERAGWDMGPFSAVVSSAYFYRDVLLLPQAVASGAVKGFWSTSAGKCLPGTPSPYYLYPPGLTATGTAFETLVVTGTTFLLP